MSHLFVILGAGASHDCASGFAFSRAEWTPPLTTQLFEKRPTFAEILSKYPLAQAAAADIRPAIAGQEPFVLEEFLREQLKGSEDPNARLRYQEIPLYLQELLFEVSRPGGFTVDPDNYHRLVSRTLALDEVTFVTLNYDTLLDERLRPYDLPDPVNDYPGHLVHLDLYPDVRQRRGWSLLKLHGSVDWGRQIRNVPRSLQGSQLNVLVRSMGERLELGPPQKRGGGLDDIRFGSGSAGAEYYYPALSVPLGAEDEFSCPPDHVEFLRERLASHERINLLVIGYSGYDKEVLRLLAESDRPVGRLGVVNESADAATATATRLSEALGFKLKDDVLFGERFTNFSLGHLEEFVRTLHGPQGATGP